MENFPKENTWTFSPFLLCAFLLRNFTSHISSTLKMYKELSDSDWSVYL